MQFTDAERPLEDVGGKLCSFTVIPVVPAVLVLRSAGVGIHSETKKKCEYNWAPPLVSVAAEPLWKSLLGGHQEEAEMSSCW